MTLNSHRHHLSSKILYWVIFPFVKSKIKPYSAKSYKLAWKKALDEAEAVNSVDNISMVISICLELSQLLVTWNYGQMQSRTLAINHIVQRFGWTFPPWYSLFARKNSLREMWNYEACKEFPPQRFGLSLTLELGEGPTVLIKMILCELQGKKKENHNCFNS